MKVNKDQNTNTKRNKFFAFFFSCGLAISSIFAAAIFLNQNSATEVDAADYSGVSSGFSRESDGSISATFTVTNNNLDMKGWLLCLFDTKPSIDSNNKLTNSNDAHPYSYSSCKHYFFASKTTKTGSITVTWSASANDQKTSWTASTGSASSPNRLTDYLNNGTNWHLIIGPRHYNTGWGDSGIGAGTNGYWENCDYYVGSLNEVIPSGDTDKDMTVTTSNYTGTYDGSAHSITINVTDPSSGYTIKYRTSSSGSYNLTSKPTYTDAGSYVVYFQITKTGYITYTGSGVVSISKANPSVTAPTAKQNLAYNGSEQALVNAGSSNLKYSLDNSSYSTSIPSGTNAGTYTVYYKVDESTNYTSYGPYSLNVTISKANPSVTAPTAKQNLVYNGSEQALVNAGSNNLKYSLDNSSYSTSIPSGTNAGTYTVYYKVDESTNYTSYGPYSLNVTISRVDPIITTTPSAMMGLKYNGDNQTLIHAGEVEGGTILYSLDNDSYSESLPEMKLCGTYTIYYSVEGDSNHFSLDAQSFQVSISPNDKTALSAVLDTSSNYLETLVDPYPRIASDFATRIADGQEVLEDDNKTVAEIEEATEYVEYGYNLAHAQVVDELIEEIGDVRYSKKCLGAIKAAEEAYNALDENQQPLVTLGDYLEEAREVYEKLEDVAEAIASIGDITYDSECYERIEAAKEAYNSLSKEEQMLIPTLFNDLNSAEDIYDMLKLISDLGDVEYTEDYKNLLEEARNAFDALDYNEQQEVYNYEDLLEAEEQYNKIDHVVDLVNNITAELEYVGTHNGDIEKARKAYDALSDEEKALVPQEIVDALETKEEEYEEIKVEHERKEVEDREAGVAIATEGGSGIPNTVSIDINNSGSSSSNQNMEDSIDYQTINESISESEEISSICEIKFYEERDGEIVELTLADIDEDMSLVIKIDVPEDVDDSNFNIVLLDENNNIVEVKYRYDPATRVATIVTNHIGTFAIVTNVPNPAPAKDNLPLYILLLVVVLGAIGAIGFFWIKEKKEVN